MLIVDVSVNGRDIGQIGIHNTGTTIGEETEYQIFDISDGRRALEREPLGRVWHDREDGAGPLIEKAFAEVGNMGFDDR